VIGFSEYRPSWEDGNFTLRFDTRIFLFSMLILLSELTQAMMEFGILLRRMLHSNGAAMQHNHLHRETTTFKKHYVKHTVKQILTSDKCHYTCMATCLVSKNY
jgi:hypothetical protein